MGIDLLQTLICVDERLSIDLDRDLFYDAPSLFSARDPPDATVDELHQMIISQVSDDIDVLSSLLECLATTTGIAKNEIKLTDFLFRDLGLDG